MLANASASRPSTPPSSAVEATDCRMDGKRGDRANARRVKSGHGSATRDDEPNRVRRARAGSGAAEADRLRPHICSWAPGSRGQNLTRVDLPDLLPKFVPRITAITVGCGNCAEAQLPSARAVAFPTTPDLTATRSGSAAGRSRPCGPLSVARDVSDGNGLEFGSVCAP